MPSPLQTAAVLAGLCGLFAVTAGAFAAEPGPQDPAKSCCSGPSSKAALLTTEGRPATLPSGLPVAAPTFTRVATTTPFGLTSAQEPVPTGVARGGGQGDAGWLGLPAKVSSEDEVEALRERLEDSLEARLEELEDLQEQLEDERERLEDLYEDLFEDLDDLEEEFAEATEVIEQEPWGGERDAAPFPIRVRGLTIGDSGQQVLFSAPDGGLRIDRVRLLDDCKECGTCDEACCAACEGCGDADCEVEVEVGQSTFAPGTTRNVQVGDLGGQIAFEVAQGLNQELGANAARWTAATDLGARGLWVAADGGQVRWIRTDDCKKCEDCSDCRAEGRCESCEDCGDENCGAEVEEDDEFAFGEFSFEEPVLLEWSSAAPTQPLPGVTTTATATEACGPHCELEAEVHAMRADLNALRDLLTPKVD